MIEKIKIECCDGLIYFLPEKQEFIILKHRKTGKNRITKTKIKRPFNFSGDSKYIRLFNAQHKFVNINLRSIFDEPTKKIKQGIDFEILVKETEIDAEIESVLNSCTTIKRNKTTSSTTSESAIDWIYQHSDDSFDFKKKMISPSGWIFLKFHLWILCFKSLDSLYANLDRLRIEKTYEQLTDQEYLKLSGANLCDLKLIISVDRNGNKTKIQ